MKAGWFKFKVLPCYDGFYDVVLADGKSGRAEFRDGKWSEAGITQWRGQHVVLRKTELNQFRSLLNSASVAMYPDEVADAARRLARHFIARGFTSKDRKVPAVTCYQLAYALAAELEPADIAALAAATERLAAKGRAKVEKNLEKLGITELNASRDTYLKRRSA